MICTFKTSHKIYLFKTIPRITFLQPTCVTNLLFRLINSFKQNFYEILVNYGQALDLLVLVSCTRYRASTSNLSTLSSSRGLTSLCYGISHLEGGFTLRCLQRLSLPNLATLPCRWSTTDTPEVRPSRSSRTKDSSSQISYAHAG